MKTSIGVSTQTRAAGKPHEWSSQRASSSGAAARRLRALLSSLVPMSSHQRLLLAATFVIYWLAVLLVNSVSAASSMSLMMLLTAFLFVRLLPILFYQPDFGWLHPLVFGCLWTMVELLRSFPIYAWGLTHHAALPAHTPQMLDKLLCAELLLMILGTGCYYLGYYSASRIPLPRLAFRPPRQISLKLILAQAFSALVFLALMRNRGGLVSHVESWGNGRSTELSGSLIFVVLPMVQLGCSAALLYLAYRPASFRSPLFITSSAISLCTVFFTTGSRSALLFLMVVALIIWMLRQQSLPWFKLSILVAVTLVALVVLGNFRRSTWSGEIDWNALTNFEFLSEGPTKITEELVERSGVMRSSLPILSLVPEQVDLLYGESYLAILAMPVPRAIWPEKPKQISGRVGAVFYGGSWGMPPGPIGESYWNFGVLGVIAVYFCFGAFHRWLVAMLLRYPNEIVVVAAYGLALFLIPSPTTYAVVNFIFAFVPLIAAAVLFAL